MAQSPKYKFYLNDTLISEPKGWDDINDILKMDRTLNGLLNYPEATFEFEADGYEILKDAFYNDFCSNITLKVLEQCSGHDYRQAYSWIIKPSRLVLNERNCTATIKPDDDGYYAKINNSRKQKAFPWVGRSKNDVSITPAERIQVAFFEPATGTYYPILAGVNQEYSCSAYRVYEIFRYLIAFMTDGEMDFDSTLFGTGGEFENKVITYGLVPMTVQTGLSEAAFKNEFPELSFDDVFTEIYKLDDIGFYIDNSGARPKMWIEYEKDIPDGTDIVTLDNIYEIKTRILTDRLYNIIKVGSTNTEDVLALAFPESIDFLGFKEEQYNTIGNCAEDVTLDLVGDWIRSSNVIEDAVVNQADTYVDEPFIVDAEKISGLYYAKQANDINPPAPPYFYNQRLVNSQVLDRFFGAIPISIAKYLGTGNDLFKARRDPYSSGNISSLLGALVSNEPVQFNDDFSTPFFDANNHWGNATAQGAQVTQSNSRFTAFANGYYVFRITIGEVVANANAGITGILVRYNAANANIGFVNKQIVFPITDIYEDVVIELSIYLVATDYVQIDITYGNFVGVNDYDKPCTLELISCPGNAIKKLFDPKDYVGLIHEFEYPISQSQMQAIKSNPRGNISFAQKTQKLRNALVDTIQFNPTGNSNLILITTFNNNV